MTDKELETLLTERCKSLDLKQAAFNSLEKILLDNSNVKNFLCGFERHEIKTIFDRFEYRIDNRYSGAVIRARIGLYIEDPHKVWLDNIERIGYYERETDFIGEVLDDFLVIESEKYIKDIDIISHFQSINQKLPGEYLRRNHIQYEFVSYISLVGTLFVSKNFEATGRFVQRAYTYLENRTMPNSTKNI